ncbi:MAG: chlorophyll synthesis pathway protein BchC [Pseudomonadota bacterium]
MTKASAVVFEQPGTMKLRDVDLVAPTDADCVVDIEWSGISTGTERLLWQGRMPPFPGLSYPLVPGYESVGRVRDASKNSPLSVGERVFVPGSTGFEGVAGLFGGASSSLVVPSEKLISLGESLGEEATLLALAGTAYHAIQRADGKLPQLVVGHGVLGRLLARIIRALDGDDLTVWEQNPARRSGALGYTVVDPAQDQRRDYRVICDVSGAGNLLDELIMRLAPGGHIVLAGFYDNPLSFVFPQAFIREIRMSVAAEWQPSDLQAVLKLIQEDRLSLDGLITHRATPQDAEAAYQQAFESAECLKMILDWRNA